MITATIKQCRLVTIKYMPIHNDCKCSVQESAKRLRDTSQVAGTFKIKNLNQDPDTRCWILKCARPRCARSLFQEGISLLETSELIRHCCRPLLRAPSHNRPKLNKAVTMLGASRGKRRGKRGRSQGKERPNLALLFSDAIQLEGSPQFDFGH